MERKKEGSPFKNMDWFLLFVVLALHTVGLLILRTIAEQRMDTGTFTKQVTATIIGIVCLIILLFFDYKDFRVLGFIAYLFTTILLVLVLYVGHGKDEVGMTGWLFLGPFSFQPSELAKITLVLVTAFFFEKISEKPSFLHYLFLLISAVVPIILILQQPDFGTAMVCIIVLLFMLFIWGLKYRYILVGVVIAAASAIPIWVYVLPKVLDPYQLKRILSFINPAAYSKDSAYQVRMAIRAIGSGQNTIDLSRDYASNYVPAVHTDMIFSALGEKIGFFGSVAVVILFALLLLRCIYIAALTKDRFGSYVVIGLSAIFFAHFLENVGMNLGLMPVTGIPLPFISSGGSSLIANDIAIGIIMGISMRKR